MKQLWDTVVGWVLANRLIVALGAFALFVVGVKKIIGDIKNEAKHAERAATAVKQAEVRVRVNERSTEIINEERQHADAALQARDHSPDYPSSDSVRDDIARVIFRD